MSTILAHMMYLSANLECRSEMCCTRLTESLKIQDTKIRHLHTIAQLCQAISSQLRHISTIRKNLLNSNISSTCPHNVVNFGPLMAEIGWRVWGTPANINGFCVLALLLHRRHYGGQPNFARCLAVFCAGTLFIHFRGLLPVNGILPGA